MLTLITKVAEQSLNLKHYKLLQKYIITLLATEKNDSLNQTNDSKINFDLKDFNDNFYDLSDNEKAIIMKLRIMNREKKAKIIDQIFE